ncbi:MAG: hypothetical protein IIA67_04800 [Planctomycetes bacterium]|nr:hypothetical protein [Planctomycetota bacterium]
MIAGIVSEDGVPQITVAIDGDDWPAIIDTGFNGDLELPEALRGKVNARYAGRVSSALAGGQMIEEDAYLVEFPFDGELLGATATFVEGAHVLVGTNLLRRHRLQIGFVSKLVELQRE